MHLHRELPCSHTPLKLLLICWSWSWSAPVSISPDIQYHTWCKTRKQIKIEIKKSPSSIFSTLEQWDSKKKAMKFCLLSTEVKVLQLPHDEHHPHETVNVKNENKKKNSTIVAAVTR